MAWELNPDCHTPFIADNVRRKTVEGLLTVLHFRDNTQIDDDPFFKVRPLFQALNTAGIKYLNTTQDFSVDEIMVKYFGKHGSKQYIHGKPIKFGYKGKV